MTLDTEVSKIGEELKRIAMGAELGFEFIPKNTTGYEVLSIGHGSPRNSVCIYPDENRATFFTQDAKLVEDLKHKGLKIEAVQDKRTAKHKWEITNLTPDVLRETEELVAQLLRDSSKQVKSRRKTKG